MFAIFDGHGGEKCCDFMKDNFHSFIFQKFNKRDIHKGMVDSCNQLDVEFLKSAQKSGICDRSGSCAIALFCVDNRLYFVNTGDSRAILSRNNGRRVEACSTDHKPESYPEFKRCIKNGGYLYRVSADKITQQTQVHTALTRAQFRKIDHFPTLNPNRFYGPWRTKPGGLSVSRTFGDIEAKNAELGGLNGVVIATPEIKEIEFSFDIDYIFLGCDGIFDVLSNEDINEIIWETIDYYKQQSSVTSDSLHMCLNDCVNNILKQSLIKKSEDNITAILIAFKHFIK